jgi:hypothetical protein
VTPASACESEAGDSIVSVMFSRSDSRVGRFFRKSFFDNSALLVTKELLVKRAVEESTRTVVSPAGWKLCLDSLLAGIYKRQA